jgi:hypothetical protein
VKALLCRQPEVLRQMLQGKSRLELIALYIGCLQPGDPIAQGALVDHRQHIFRSDAVLTGE